MKGFEEKIRKIFHYIAEYGVHNKPIKFWDPNSFTQKDKEEFIYFVHQGFRLGQELILQEIISLFKDRKLFEHKLSEHRKAKEKNLIGETQERIQELDLQIKILRHFADFIAWQVFKGDYYKARRFYSGNPKRPDLLNTNLESVILAAENLHKQNKNSFALITDLTSFIDIGDILYLADDKIYIVECKQGMIQHKVFKFIEELCKPDFDPEKIDYTDKNKKFFDQTERTLKQFSKGRRAIDFLKKEFGTDPFSDLNIKVLESASREYYFDYMLEGLKDSKKNDSTYREVEGVIYIGIFRDEKLPICGILFSEIVKTLYEKYLIADYLHLLNLPLKEPLFFKPFGSEIIFDLIFGRLKILVAINLNGLIDLFNKRGIKARWLTRKETNAVLDKGNRYKPFVFENRAIEVQVKGKNWILGDSFLIYLMLDHIKPSSFVAGYSSLNKFTDEND